MGMIGNAPYGGVIGTGNILNSAITADKLSSTAIQDKLGFIPQSANDVSTAIANLVSSAPSTLNTLDELAAALGDDANFATTITTSLGTKLTKSNNLSDLTDIATARTNLGLGNVENKSSTTIRSEITSLNVTTALGFTPVNKAGDTLLGPLHLNGYGLYSDTELGIFTDSGNAQAIKVKSLYAGGSYAAHYPNTGEIAAQYQLKVTDNPTRISFYTYANSNPSGYIHLKTNRRTNESQMHCVRFEGYDYSGAKPIFTLFGWYNYGGVDNMISTGSWGTHNASGYRSSDGYAVLVIQTSTYYVGFTLSQQYSGPQGLADISITAVTSTGSPTGAY